MSVEEARYQTAIANRILAEVDLAPGGTGHASMRVPGSPDLFVVKGRGYEVDLLSVMRPEQMIVCDLEGNYVDGPPGTTQCFEVKMHSCIYREYPDVMSVVHVHPHYVVQMTILDVPIRPMNQGGSRLFTDPFPVYRHMKTVQSEDEGAEVAKVIAGRKAVLLTGHGATMTGRSLPDAVGSMRLLEEQALLNWEAYCAAGRDYPTVPADLIAEMNGRTPIGELPHFAPVYTGQSASGEGWYTELARKVSADF